MRFIQLTALFLLLHSSTFSQEIFYPELDSFLDPALAPFYFGVASGDPHPDRVVLWTKIFTEEQADQVVGWEIATDTAMQNTVQSGIAETGVPSAFTVKLEIQNLSPGTVYFYRFKHRETHSPIGRTKTAPSGSPGQLRLAVVSCADYQSGHFNAFGDIARRNDLDAVVHLGDYIYEYGVWRGGRRRMVRSRVRQHIPDKVCTTLKDYRTRYAQYRCDPQLREAHRLHPFIVIWDDHEVANDSHVAGTASRPDGGETWEQQKAVATQAYFEWLPIREDPQRSIVRSFTYGDLAEMWMLDGRLEGRSPHATGLSDTSLYSPDRHILGEAQREWLLTGIKNSQAKWKIIGNQVIFSPLNDSKVFTRRPSIAMDRWDGYPAERQLIFDFFYENELDNIVVITGDVHTAWALELTAAPSDPEVYDRKTGKGVVGAEFVTPSVTSLNFDEVIPKFIVVEAKRRFKKRKNNPHLRYVNLIHHGYMTLTLTPERAQADWFFVKRKDRVDERVKKKATRYIENGGRSVEKK